MHATIEGPWTLAEAETFLKSAALPMRLACVAADGYPRVVSLWYRFEAERLYAVTHQDSSLARLLRRNGRVGFEVAPNEPPYHGIRGQADVTLEPLGNQSTLRELLDRYLGGFDSGVAQWLLSRSDEEVLITIEPTRLYSWDYRERMADVG